MTEMPDRESAEAIDKVLERFRGDQTVVKTEIEKEYANDMGKYYEIENHLATLLDDALIKVYKNPGNYVLDNRGIRVISKMHHWGYTANFDANEKKRIEEEQIKTKQTIHIDGDVHNSNLSQLSDLRDNVLESPKTESASNKTPTIPPKTSVLEKIAWIIGIIVGLLAIYEFILKKFL